MLLDCACRVPFVKSVQLILKFTITSANASEQSSKMKCTEIDVESSDSVIPIQFPQVFFGGIQGFSVPWVQVEDGLFR